MAPKMAESAALKAKPGPAHASYQVRRKPAFSRYNSSSDTLQDMIIDAIVNVSFCAPRASGALPVPPLTVSSSRPRRTTRSASSPRA